MSASAQVAHTSWCQDPLQKNHSPSLALRANVTNSTTPSHCLGLDPPCRRAQV